MYDAKRTPTLDRDADLRWTESDTEVDAVLDEVEDVESTLEVFLLTQDALLTQRREIERLIG